MTFNAIVCWGGDNFDEISQEVYAALPRSEPCGIEVRTIPGQITPPFENLPQRALDGMKSETYDGVTVRAAGTPSISVMVFRPRFDGDPLEHWLFQLEAPPDVCRDIYARGKRNKFVSFIALSVDDTPDFDHPMVNDDNFDWGHWGLMVAAVRQVNGEWIERLGPAAKGTELIPTRFEHAVLQQLLEGEHPAMAAMQSQLGDLVITQRHHSGVGFFVHFELRNERKRISWFPPRVVFGDVQATIESLENGAGFLLVVENGAISILEGYSYDEPWPAEIAAFTLRYSDALRAATLAALPKV